ncbi:DNA transformation protein [Vibrio astriarenae]|uniref:DNA transformation protein n=1 Tax=Vibrio astriarenae TaxID=1481923 RepID=A0A7Z2T606_9VIBR|nr:TfoX/Sxy family DNA transformation protein [Vibrio astriarenae]QIA64808.1 DNA transformation protein [Vibrio astriarenae]
MDKPILKDSMRLFEQLGTVKSRSMFGGFGIFVNDTMFALVVKNKLHVRKCADLETAISQHELEPYVYEKRGFPVVTKYFQLPDSWVNEPARLLSVATTALKAAVADKVKQETTKPQRLKDLPNLRLATERMLKKAGIETVTQLEEAGAVRAYQAIQESHTTPVSLELLYSLEGAIRGTHWTVIPQPQREDLASQIN